MKTPFLKTVLTIVRKDLRAELRSRELVTSMALFAFLSVLIFSFALEMDKEAREEAVSGVLWVTVVYASTIGLNCSMAGEREQGNLDAMLISPVDRSAIFFGKLVGNLIFTLLVGLLLLPLMLILYNKAMVQPWLLAVLTLGTVGFVSVGTLLATMTTQTRARESLLPIVMMPIALPVLLAAVRATTAILTDEPFADWIFWPQLLLAVDAIYLLLCYLLFEYVIEE